LWLLELALPQLLVLLLLLQPVLVTVLGSAK
jgi:hypothetical protein